jgi:hypothetical protein
VFGEYLLGFEGTPCVILSGVLKQHQTIKFACRCRYARSDRMLQLLAQFSEFSDVGFGSVWVSRPRRLGASWLGFR